MQLGHLARYYAGASASATCSILAQGSVKWLVVSTPQERERAIYIRGVSLNIVRSELGIPINVDTRESIIHNKGEEQNDA